jgi:DNA-binding CsgD family transcriptional regulator
MSSVVAPELLEREPYAEALEGWLGEARAGRGRLVLLAGEAGIGKTALVRRFCARDRGPRVLWGACDGLRTPRPLGPFVDIAADTGGVLRDAVEAGAKPAGCFEALLAELEEDQPTIMVLEDLQWADEATLDVLTMLGRRVEGTGALTIATFRDDGPLRPVIGELGAVRGVRRLELPSLSPEAVGRLAEPYGVDGSELHRVTAGNPFFVTEVLEGGDGEIPATVRDAVLARAAHLDPMARRVLDAVAIAPQHVDIALLERLLDDELEHLDDCLASGMLLSEGRFVGFRHELARLAVEEAILPHRRVALHRRMLAALRDGPPDLAALAYHAEEAGDAAAVLDFARRAGEAAASLGAHREAAAQYARALRHADGLALGELGELLERSSHESHLIAEFDDSIAAMEAALDCYRRRGDERSEGLALRSLARTMYCIGGREDRARELAADAVAVLERLDPGPELGRAYGLMTALSMDAEDVEGTRVWGPRAMALAEHLGDAELRIALLNDLGTIEFLHGRPEGREKLEESLALALRGGLEEDVARGYLNMSWAATRTRELGFAEAYLRDGIEYCTARDLELHRLYLYAFRARLDLDRGRWDDAAEFALLVTRDPRTSPDARAPALAVLGLVRARRGDPHHWAPLDEAQALLGSGALQRLAPVAAARAEALWLQGRDAEIEAATSTALQRARERGVPWVVGELECWRRRAGRRVTLAAGEAAEPYALEIAGDCAGAAERWRALGCPYEAAVALSGADDPEALRQALDELRAMGAHPAAGIVARRLRVRGVRGLPRGPRRQTRENPAGLTGRELEVLRLLAEGMRNAQIAERLVISERTVGHHVSGVLRKLGVSSRGEAVAKATRLDASLG